MVLMTNILLHENSGLLREIFLISKVHKSESGACGKHLDLLSRLSRVNLHSRKK
jgi:hypothetical protein